MPIQVADNLPLSVLELRWLDLPGEVGDGWSVSARRFLDFMVDGRSLYEDLGCRNITLLGWLRPEVHQEAVDQLLMRKPSALAEDRRELYVCSECADIDCGSITIVVTREGNRFVWSGFAHHVNYSYNEGEDHMISRRGYEHVGPFAFDVMSYASTLETALEILKDQLGEPGY